MRVQHLSGFGELDVGATVVQMDQITWELKSALSRAESQWALMFTSQQAEAIEQRLSALRGLISELDVGGAGREHVFFPLPGQTQDEAWATYREMAENARQSFAQLGQFISQWSLTAALPRIANDVRNEVKTDLSWVAVGLGVVGVISVLGMISNARRAFSGFGGRRRKR